MTIVVAQAVDPAVGLTDRADFFAMATVALDVPTRKYHLLDMRRGRFETTEQPHIVREEYEKWANPPGATFYKVGIETIFAQTFLFNHLRKEGMIPLMEIARRSGTGSKSMSKYMRLLGLAGRYERGDILHPGVYVDGEWRPDYGRHAWLEDYEAELMGLTEAGIVGDTAKDDQSDSVAMAVDMLGRLLLSMTATQEAPTWHTIQWGG